MSRPSPNVIALRAYTEKPGTKPVAAKGKFKGNDTPSPWTLVFDTETTIDAAQQIRVGFFQVYKSYGRKWCLTELKKAAYQVEMVVCQAAHSTEEIRHHE